MMFQGMNDTDYLVHSMRFQERLAKSEKYLSLVRGDVITAKGPKVQLAIRWPRFPLARRVVHALQQPA